MSQTPADPLESIAKMPKSAEGYQALRDGQYADAELISRDMAAEARTLFGQSSIQMDMVLQELVKALEAQDKRDGALMYEELASQILLKQKWRK